MIKTDKATGHLMEKYDIPYPDKILHCWWCGSPMDTKITHKLVDFDEQTGEPRYELRNRFSCPKWNHSIGVFSSSDPYNNMRYSTDFPIWRDGREIARDEFYAFKNWVETPNK